VIGGMITGTFLAIFFVPTFFVVVRSLFKGEPRPGQAAPATIAEHKEN
jgi:multidrug efflux pump